MSVAADRADPRRAALYKGMEVRQENEYERLRMQHELHKNAMHGELIQVPLSKSEPIRVLDSATGDGLWMKDVAKQYPNATLVGTDINATHFEQIKDLPSSISFKIQSVLDPWPAEDHCAYDLVHQRYCLAMFNPQKEEEIVRGLLDLVKPGGRIQLIDANLLGYDGGLQHPGMDQMMAYMERGFREAGMNAAPGPLIAGWLQKAGAVDVQDRVFSFSMGCLAATPEAQASTSSNLCAMIDNFAMIGSKIPDYWFSQDQFKALKEAVLEEMEITGNTWRFHVVTATKSS
ncbi:hypothetical protein DPV78_005240 [Talaromyces pinophilus]|nr:hypothetical protein DPV78_005240 [Talaromyces pinophilus]